MRLLSQLQSGGMPQQQAAQQAAPSAAQPGGGPQTAGNFTPEQQMLLADINLVLVAGDKMCKELKKQGHTDQALKCEDYLNKVARMSYELQQEFGEEMMEHSINAAAGGPNGTAAGGGGMGY